MNVHDRISLKQYNTFGIDVTVGRFIELFDESDFVEFAEKFKGIKMPIFILGGGSNVVFTSDIHPRMGYVVHPHNSDVRVLERTDDYTLVEAEAGVQWDGFVEYCTMDGMYGLENLAGIPGTVGAAPVQNIGAYGTEAKDFIERVHVFDIDEGTQYWLSNEECHFGYRHSVFKEDNRTRIVDRVVFRLRNRFEPDLRYKALADRWNDDEERKEIEQYFSGRKEEEKYLAHRMAKLVREIRDSKLPNPKEIGSAGSFFKNPVVDAATFQKLKSSNPDIVSFPAPNGMYKLSAGWLIEQCGWKGRREGNVGVYEKQALVLVNYGGGTGEDVVWLARKIIKDVLIRFGITLEPEAIILDGLQDFNINRFLC